jgi:hypothetical protein
MPEKHAYASSIRGLARGITRSWRAFAATLLCLLFTACNGGGSSGAVSPPSSSSTVSLATISTTTAASQNYYETLPHTDLQSDLSALAAYISSTQPGASASVTPGGVVVMYSDGTTLVLFADRLDNAGAAAAAQAPSAAANLPFHIANDEMHLQRETLPLSDPSAHEVAFLINTADTTGAFNPIRQQAFAGAFSPVLAGGPYSVDDLDVSLENILALSSGHPIDYLDIATHGLVVEVTPLVPYYVNLSTTQVTSGNLVTYAADIKAGRLIYGTMLVCAGCTNFTPGQPYYAFTPDFLTAHLTFNPGAIVLNNSCWGQSPLVAAAVVASFQSAGVGFYLGWTKEVNGDDADETDAFLIDRLLGEQVSSDLNKMVAQDTPLQQPFPLSNIITTINALIRNPSDPLNTGVLETYALSDAGYSINASYEPTADGTAARLIASFLPNSSLATAPIEYSMPSLFQMQVAESATSGTLTLLGAFPSTPGSVVINCQAGGSGLPVTSWSATQITATLPAAGTCSSGEITVVSSDDISSNEVPLTQWSGQLTYTEQDTIPTLSGVAGSGTGTIQALYTLSFRADVHSFAQTIEAAAVPQNLTISGPIGSSTVVVTKFEGDFTTSDGSATATFSLLPSAPAMTPVYSQPVPDGLFGIAAYSGQPASCNNGLYGPQPGPTNVFCPATGFRSVDVGTCTDSDGTLCPDEAFSPAVGFSVPGGNEGGLLVFTMDPMSYVISVSSTPGVFSGGHFGGTDRPSTASMTGTIQAPSSPPAPLPATSTASAPRAF